MKYYLLKTCELVQIDSEIYDALQSDHKRTYGRAITVRQKVKGREVLIALCPSDVQTNFL